MSKPLDDNTIAAALAKLDGWSRAGDKIHKHFEFKDFKAALTFIVAVGLEAEGMDHHPELSNVYNNVDISLSTHDAGDKITEKDVKLAEKIENISLS